MVKRDGRIRIKQKEKIRKESNGKWSKTARDTEGRVEKQRGQKRR